MEYETPYAARVALARELLKKARKDVCRAWRIIEEANLALRRQDALK